MFFGIVALILVGLSWTVVGMVMGLAPKKGVDAAAVNFFGACVSITAGLIMAAFTEMPDISFQTAFWSTAAYIGTGFINCIMLSLMAYSMQRGPNGVIWTAIQSAMIFPFICGMVFFDVEAKFIRIAGLMIILSGLFLSGIAKDNTSTGKGWKLPTLIAFLLTGIQQCITSMPSYFEEAQKISPIVRALLVAFGTLISASVIMSFFGSRKGLLKRNIHNKYLWIFVGSMQFFSLLFAYIFFYPGMDALAKCGMGSMSYPLMVSSCIVGFGAYSVFIIREKNTLTQYAALLCCFIGIIMICL